MRMPVDIFAFDIRYAKTIALFVQSRAHTASDIRGRQRECALRHLEATQIAVQCDRPPVVALGPGTESDFEELFAE